MKSESMIKGIRPQRGVATLAIGVLLLVLITLMTLYGARVGLMEQRISGNEYRAKLAHGAAEAGRNNATEFLNSNLAVFVSDEDEVFLPDGTVVEGWRTAGNDRWGDSVTLDCDSPASGHERAACNAGMGGDVYYYRADPSVADPSIFDVFETADFTSERVALNTTRDGDEVRVSYNADFILCPLDVDLTVSPPVMRDPPCVDDFDAPRYFAVLVHSEGFLVGDMGGDEGVERLEPMVQSSEVVVKYDVFGAGPSVPLTVASTFSGSGTFDIVTNPNGGATTPGEGRSGAPFTVWSADPYAIGGSTVTCQRYEFFAYDPDSNRMYDDAPPNNRYKVCDDCQCPHKSDPFYYLSSDNIEAEDRIDIVDDVPLCSTVADPDNMSCFPDDLFLYTFGVPREDYQILKDLATKIPSEEYPDCSALDKTDSGLFWVETACQIGSDAGTPHNPILLIGEGDNIEVRAGAKFFGVIYAFGPPDTGSNPDLTLNGGAQIYGAVVGDSAGSGKGTGNNVIIFDQAVLDRVALSPDIQRVSPLPGTWTDRRVAP